MGNKMDFIHLLVMIKEKNLIFKDTTPIPKSKAEGPLMGNKSKIE